MERELQDHWIDALISTPEIPDFARSSSALSATANRQDNE